MNAGIRFGLLIALLLACVALAGCPGMPGGAAGRGASSQLPPGLQPPTGLGSGGARTLMGTTITPPENSVLLVRYSYAPASAQQAKPLPTEWQSCRRVIPAESYVLVEGVNYDGRDKAAEKDVNQLIPAASLAYLYWKYEPKPAAAAPAPSGRSGRSGRGGPRPGPAQAGRPGPERATSRPASGR